MLITPDGGAVLTDFGIATLAGDPGLTQAGMVVGTPGFTAPERVRGDARDAGVGPVVAGRHLVRGGGGPGAVRPAPAGQPRSRPE